MTVLTAYLSFADDVAIVKSVAAKQRHPWDGLVDIVVTFQGNADEMNGIHCMFTATNSATQSAVPVMSVTLEGSDSVSGNVCTRRYIWNATNDVGAVKIDDLALTVNAKILGGVQLWENGPYWAECNVGATKPEEYGCYFWWGDTVGYKRNADNTGWVSVKDDAAFSFSSGNCPTFNKDTSILRSLGYIDSTGNLVAAHDVANVYLGEPWRMPTDADFAALIKNCTTTWSMKDGVYGRLVTGKGAYASKSIFLPAAGYGDDSFLVNIGSYGSYWSSTSYSGYSCWARNLYFSSGDFVQDYYDRYRGRSVRSLRGLAK